MCPYAEPPIFPTDEIGMILLDAAIVNRFLLPAVADVRHGHEPAVIAAQHVPGLQRRRFDPSLARNIEGMLGCRPNHAAAHMHVPHARERPEQLSTARNSGLAAGSCSGADSTSSRIVN